MVRLTRELAPDARHVLVGTALVVFVFRAVPGPGEGATWWMIDKLGFDQHFLSVLSLIGKCAPWPACFSFGDLPNGPLPMSSAFSPWRPLSSAPHRQHVLRAAPMDRGADRRCGRCAVYRLGEYGARIAAGPDLDDSHVGLDCELCAGEFEGHVFFP